MKIVIAVTRGFHLRHLARELIAAGRDVTYLTYLPRFRITRDGIPLARARSYFLSLQPWSGAALMRYPARLVEAATDALFARADEAYARDLPPCDIFIGLSAMTIRSAKVARERFGAKIIIERGSRHVLSQKAILAESGARPLSQNYIDRELAGYALADYIALPSQHAVDSFRERGFADERLFRNPYGVELGVFALSERPPWPLRLVFVGNWGYRKGCDAIARMLADNPDLHVTHVGTRGDLEFPTASNFTSLGHRSHGELARVLRGQHVLLLPSREDGFGMVLLEALAVGLPVIASTKTGGPDLAGMIGERNAVAIVPPADARALTDAVRRMEVWLRSRPANGSILTEADKANLSWAAYAKRYDAFLSTIA